MHHILLNSSSSSNSNDDPIFSKPQGTNFPSNKGTPTTPQTEYSTNGQSQNLLDLSSMIGLPFPSKAILQDLELGKITLIDQDLLSEEEKNGKLKKVGKAKGVYVARSEEEEEEDLMMMMAMTANFDDNDNGVRIFGVQRNDVLESHVAVIGGSGKYEGANGYAVVKVVNRVGFHDDEDKIDKVTSHKFLLFHVYLS